MYEDYDDYCLIFCTGNCIPYKAFQDRYLLKAVAAMPKFTKS